MSVSSASVVVAPQDPGRSSKRALDPIERVSEVVFGLIMVLTFTGSLSVATAGHAEVREMLVGALGCNLAWGVIDALLYLMASLADKGRGLAVLHAVRGASDPGQGQRLIADALPPVVAGVLDPPQLEAMRERLKRLPEPPERPRLEREDWRAGFAVLLLVFVSTLPVAIPFILFHDAHLALRVSNGIAVAMLFVCGYTVGRLTRYHPWGMGLGMVILGAFLVSMTMALGG
jgi:VIT1/CCC1 family predicted Fe2+/Mn2+ transporter